MTLKHPMEEKQLNFNQPLLSIRRGSSTPSEINKRKTSKCSPNLPPLPYYRSELKSGPVRNPGAVPFEWEQTPGKPKHESKEQRETLEQLPLAPKLPPGRVVNQKQKSIDKASRDSPGSSSRSQRKNCTACSPEISSISKVLSEPEAEERENENEAISSSGDENVIYEDARDTLSRTESFFLNCSLSGVSGLEANAERSGAVLDPQVRDFMMGRFLPAAKAVASDTPQFVSKKHPMNREQPKLVKRVINSTLSPICYDVHNVSLHNIHGESEDEEEEDEGEYEGPEDWSAKLCGLLPRFCLLNPIPGMRDHAQIVSQVRSVCRQPAHNAPSIKNRSIKNENKDRIGNHIAEVKRITWQSGPTNKSSLKGHFGRKTIAPFKEGSPESFLGLEKGFLGLPEEPRDFRVKVDINKKGFTRLKELLADDLTEGTTGPTNPISERTLYIDSEQRAESRNSNSSSSDSRGRTPSVDYALQDVLSHCGGDEKAVSQPRGSHRADSCLLHTSEKSDQHGGQGSAKDLRKDQELSLVVHVQQPTKSDVKETIQKSGPQLVMAPLLPKSPSESWLSRTLPSMSSKNPISNTCLGNPAFKPSPLDANRGKLRRNSNGQHTLFQPPELAPILEN